MSEKERKERLRAPIPERELKRRHEAVRSVMKAKGIDCLIMQNCNKHLGGYVRWFTDVFAENSYPITVIFPLNDDMTMITCGGPPRPAFPPLWATYRVKEVIGLPFFLTFNYTNTMDAEATETIIRNLKAKTVGIVGPAFMPSTFDRYLRDRLPNIEFIDVTNNIDDIKAIKSDDELEFVKKTCAIQDSVIMAIPAFLHPRMKEIELRAIIQHLLSDMGAEEQLLMLGSASVGALAKHSSPYLQNRVIGEKDYVTILIETNGPGGMYAEIARVFCLSDPTEEMMKLWETNVKAQRLSSTMLKPGANLAAINTIMNNFLEENGYPIETSLYVHGQGYDLVERPANLPDETMTVKPNMNIAVHPRLSTDTAFTFCCDNFLTTENEPIRLHKAPQELFVIPQKL